MKNVFLFVLFFAITEIVAQTSPPQAFNYSGVARNAAGNPIATQTIGLQLTILKNSALGPIQYQENHFVNTDAFGLFNVAVGTGAIQQGIFSSISWDNDNYYLKVGLDVAGGSSFVTMGTTQLLSVPYAFHSKTADSVVNAVVTELDPVFAASVSSGISAIDTANWNNKQDVIVAGSGISISGNSVSVINPSYTHYIGEQFGGGVVFHVYKDNVGVEHGLIVSLNDLSTSPWGLSGINVTNCESTWNGMQNTNSIISAGALITDAGGVCNASTSGGQSDWYLPSITELNLLYNNLFNVNRTLSSIGGATEIVIYNGQYWSSTEFGASSAYNMNFSNFTCTDTPKIAANIIRGVRSY